MPRAGIAACQASLQLWSTCLELSFFFFVRPCFSVCVPVSCDMLPVAVVWTFAEWRSTRYLKNTHLFSSLQGRAICATCFRCTVIFLLTDAHVRWCLLSVFYYVFLIVAKHTYWEKCPKVPVNDAATRGLKIYSIYVALVICTFSGCWVRVRDY